VDADSFLGKVRARTGLNFDLPTEAQWEYACRAGTTTTYGYGNTANGNYMWYRDNSSSQTHEVGTKSPNPWGLYDMHGNVWEWCLDRNGTLSYGTDPKGSSSGSYRVRRGGSWHGSASGCASSFRGNDFPSYESDYYGFRLSRALSD
jgi:formylglycine-generating enzyme required for sulfatase activity